MRAVHASEGIEAPASRSDAKKRPPHSRPAPAAVRHRGDVARDQRRQVELVDSEVFQERALRGLSGPLSLSLSLSLDRKSVV